MALSEILFSNIKIEVENYLKQQYNSASLLFTPASPYGQILTVLESFHSLSFLYLKNAI